MFNNTSFSCRHVGMPFRIPLALRVMNCQLHDSGPSCPRNLRAPFQYTRQARLVLGNLSGDMCPCTVPNSSNSQIRADEHKLVNYRPVLLGFAALNVCCAQKASAESLLEQGQRYLSSGDALISLAFTVAVVGLGAITLGVLYLSLSTWNDSRLEKEERERFEKAYTDRGPAGSNNLEERRLRSRDKAKVASKGGGKGFGGR